MTDNSTWKKPELLRFCEETFQTGDGYKPDDVFGDQQWDFEIGDVVEVLRDVKNADESFRVCAGDVCIVRNRRNPYGPPAFSPGEYWKPLLYVEITRGSGTGGEVHQSNFVKRQK